MLEIKAKVGTMPAKYIYVGFKRKLPVEGQLVRFRYSKEGREKWKQAKVDMIKDVGYPLYYLSLI